MHEIDLKAGLLEPNDAIARENREFLAAHGIYAVDIMSPQPPALTAGCPYLGHI